jgi:hypothetical protein
VEPERGGHGQIAMMARAGTGVRRSHEALRIAWSRTLVRLHVITHHVPNQPNPQNDGALGCVPVETPWLHRGRRGRQGTDDPGGSCLLHTIGHYRTIGQIERTPEPCERPDLRKRPPATPASSFLFAWSRTSLLGASGSNRPPQGPTRSLENRGGSSEVRALKPTLACGFLIILADL